MKTSVAITTYNGKRYLTDLLDSLKNQSREIDEVLIFDDCSSDGTVDLLNDYIIQNNLHG